MRDEWCHLLRLFQHHEFPDVFPAAAIFLSNTKQSTMPKRNSGKKGPKKGPAVAKPRPTYLVSRNLLSANQISSLDSGASHVRVNSELDPNSVLGNIGGTCARQSPKTQQRVLKSGRQIIRVQGAQGTVVQCGACERAGSIGKTGARC